MSKQDLLGTVHRPPVTDNNVPTKEVLKKPFASSQSVIRVFCTGCGSDFGIGRRMIDNHPEFTELVHLTDDNLAGKFFQVKRCIACDTKCREGELIEIESVT